MMESKLIKAKESLPNRRVFLTGSGRPVLPRIVMRFCRALVNGCMDAKVDGHYDFVLGFAACLDAIARGTVDFSEDPLETVARAWRDVENVTTRPNQVTDIMREAGEPEGDR